MINYALLNDALAYYVDKEGFSRIEVPWTVSEPIARLTIPEHVHAHVVTKNEKKKVFVGSAEQSFISLANKGVLLEHPKTHYVACSPCMRDDDFDELHTKYFMKVELFSFIRKSWFGVDTESHRRQIQDVADYFGAAAFDFFSSCVIDTELLTREKGDILYNGIELGSYGYRESPTMFWAYGTGVAEPRFSIATRWKEER